MILADATSCLAWLALWLVLILAIAMSALFSAMETGIYVANKIRLELQAEGGVAGAKRLRNLLRNPNSLLVVHPGSDEDWRRQELAALRGFTFAAGMPNRLRHT